MIKENKANESFQTVIGIEVHSQLKTKSKLFCGCQNQFGAEPNSNTCHICTGNLGALPVLNKKAVDFAIKVGLATNCKIAKFCEFSRKHYSYPDLTKNYQITQGERPICYDGFIEISADAGGTKKVQIQRIHIEEDAGKSIHLSGYSCVDFNRAGAPLIEIVSGPDISSKKEAIEYMEKLRAIIQYVEASNANMDEGSFRGDVNVSVKRTDAKALGTKVELKNINSFKFIENAIDFEVQRQIEMLNSGQTIVQETRGYDEKSKSTYTMRSKENAHDYRYFIDPDLPTLMIDDHWIDKIRKELPELPEAKKTRFISEFGLSEYEATILVQSKTLSNLFERASIKSKLPRLVCNWILRDLLSYLKNSDQSVEDLQLEPAMLAELVIEIENGVISSSAARDVFIEMIQEKTYPSIIIEKRGLAQISSKHELEALVDTTMTQYPEQFKDFLSGNDRIMGFLVGQVIKASGGKANPKVISGIIVGKRR